MSDEEEETTDEAEVETEGDGIDSTEPVEAPSLTDGPDNTESAEVSPDDAEGEQAAPAVVADQITPDLYYDAVQAGLDKTDFAQITTATELKRAISIAQRLKPKKEDSGPTQQAEELQIDALFPDLPKDVEFDDKFRQTWEQNRTGIRQLHEHHKQQVQQFHGVIQQMQHERRVERFESGLDKLPDGAKVFGTSDERSKEQTANCEKLWNAVNTVANGYISRREPVPSEAKLKTEAHRLAFGENIKKAAISEVTQKLEKRRTQFSIPPTQRNPVTAPDLRQQKLNAMAKVRKAKGIAS